MGLRQAINANPVVTAAVAAAVLVAALAFVTVRGCSTDHPPPAGRAAKAFFSTDDGKTYFADDATHVPPYTVNRPGDANHGKTACRAVVVRCGTGEPFVWALERYASADKRKIETIIAQQGDRAVELSRSYLGGASALVKKPGTGDTGWIKLSATTAEQYEAIVRPECPDGAKVEVLVAE